MGRLIAFSAVLLGAAPVVSAQVSGDLAQLVESRQELTMDYNILQARLKDNTAEYSLGAFCTSQGVAGLTEAARKARQTYCAQKATDFNSKDADLRAQLQKLALSVQELDAKILEARKAAATPKSR